VFAEPQTLETITAVCDGTPDLVASLVDHSLLIRVTEKEARFGMLETVREFALELLEQSDEKNDLRRWHANYVISLVETGNTQAHAGTPGFGDLRLALDWLVSRRDPRVFATP
jgi:hypothetical protein